MSLSQTKKRPGTRQLMSLQIESYHLMRLLIQTNNLLIALYTLHENQIDTSPGLIT